jgi:hypothetical protein
MGSWLLKNGETFLGDVCALGIRFVGEVEFVGDIP